VGDECRHRAQLRRLFQPLTFDARHLQHRGPLGLVKEPAFSKKSPGRLPAVSRTIAW
jgi:hypothetical protein